MLRLYAAEAERLFGEVCSLLRPANVVN